MDETERRRAIQLACNEEHGTTPISIDEGRLRHRRVPLAREPERARVPPSRRPRRGRGSRARSEKLAVTSRRRCSSPPRSCASNTPRSCATRSRSCGASSRRSPKPRRSARRNACVPEHPRAAQLRARRHARGDRGGGASVRPQDQRLDEAVQGERGSRSREPSRRSRRCRRLLDALVTTAPPRDRELEAAKASTCGRPLRVVSARARCGRLAPPVGADHRPARALRRAGEGPAPALADDPARDRRFARRRSRRRRARPDRRRRHDRAGEATASLCSLAGAIVLLILYRKVVQKRPLTVRTRAR